MNLQKNEALEMRNRIARILRIALMAIIFVAIFSFIVMELWNWLVPGVFGWHRISFWQALGLLVLSKILFGGFRGGWGHRGHWPRRMRARWEQMTPEEREKFRKGLMGCCAHSDVTGGADVAHSGTTPAVEH
jgi:Ca2+/H+ antiporter, TMEM165/GDT1 family